MEGGGLPPLLHACVPPPASYGDLPPKLKSMTPSWFLLLGRVTLPICFFASTWPLCVLRHPKSVYNMCVIKPCTVIKSRYTREPASTASMRSSREASSPRNAFGPLGTGHVDGGEFRQSLSTTLTSKPIVVPPSTLVPVARGPDHFCLTHDAMTSTILLAVHCKKGESLDLRKAVNTYVAGTYGVQVGDPGGGVAACRRALSHSPAGRCVPAAHGLLPFPAPYPPPQAAEEAGDDMQEIQSLRDDIVNLSGSLQHLRRTLSKYYRMLALMESRFPLSRSQEGVNLTFSWADAFKPSKRAEQASLDFERAAILFNLGAVASQQGLACERRSEAGLRESARVFQEAAGYFAALREGPCLRIERPAPMDLTPEAADMLCHMMLAQAQECVFEKAAADRKSPALLAR